MPSVPGSASIEQHQGGVPGLDQAGDLARFGGDRRRVDPAQRPVLPIADLLEHRVEYAADQVRRHHLHAVEPMQVGLDLAHRHAARIERQNAVVEDGEPVIDTLCGFQNKTRRGFDTLDKEIAGVP